MRPSPDLGILVVHGIGKHKQGETLNEFAAPIVKWIDRWLVDDLDVQRMAGNLATHARTKDHVGEAKFETGTLRPPDLPLDTPAHARATIRGSAPGLPPVSQEWLFAESWWSPQTLTPRVSPFLLWLITRGPWLMLMHLSQRFGIDYGQLAREAQAGRGAGVYQSAVFFKMLWFAAVTGLWLAISLVLIVLWCVVSLVALVPIGYVRRQVYALLIEITGVVGDSYVLINDPIQRVAFANSARRALAWLREQGCRKIAVVAHSQGAAVAQDVLLAPGAEQVDLLVTLGPGIAKLEALSERERLAPQTFLWAGAAAPLTLATVAAFVRLYADGQTGFAFWGLPLLLGLVAAICVFVTWHHVDESLQRLQPSLPKVLLMNQWQRKMCWRDFFASHDPVSNGPLAATIGLGWGRIASRRVMVLASVLADHTSYWTSRADFVPRVVAALDRCAGAGLFPTRAGLARIARGSAVYRRAVGFLQLQRWAATAAFFVPVFAWTRVRAVATELHRVLEDLPFSALTGALDAVDATFDWIGSSLLGGLFQGGEATGLLLLGGLAAVALNVWGRIVTYWWQNLASALLVPVFAPSAGSWPSRIGRALLAALVATLGALPPVLAVAWTFYPQAIAWSSLREFLAMFVTLAVMVLFALLVAALVLASVESVSSLRAERRKVPKPTWAAAIQAVPDLWVAPVGWLLYGGIGGWLLAINRYTPRLLWPAGLLVVIGAVLYRWREPLRRAWRRVHAWRRSVFA